MSDSGSDHVKLFSCDLSQQIEDNKELLDWGQQEVLGKFLINFKFKLIIKLILRF